jgi:hypothetical protein
MMKKFILLKTHPGLDKYVQTHREAQQRIEDAGVKNSEAFYISKQSPSGF